MVEAQMARSDQISSNETGFSNLVYGVQFFFGGWFLFHGANFFLHFFHQPPGSSVPSHLLIAALIQSGLFNWVKIIEILVGIALLANRFVPLAIVAAFPITFVIAYDNVALNQDTFSHIVAVVIVAFNLIMALGYLETYLPMLAFNAGTPSARGLATLFRGHSPRIK